MHRLPFLVALPPLERTASQRYCQARLCTVVVAFYSSRIRDTYNGGSPTGGCSDGFNHVAAFCTEGNPLNTTKAPSHSGPSS